MAPRTILKICAPLRRARSALAAGQRWALGVARNWVWSSHSSLKSAIKPAIKSPTLEALASGLQAMVTPRLYPKSRPMTSYIGAMSHHAASALATARSEIIQYPCARPVVAANKVTCLGELRRAPPLPPDSGRAVGCRKVPSQPGRRRLSNPPGFSPSLRNLFPTNGRRVQASFPPGGHPPAGVGLQPARACGGLAAQTPALGRPHHFRPRGRFQGNRSAPGFPD